MMDKVENDEKKDKIKNDKKIYKSRSDVVDCLSHPAK